jgi:hypothetical protein
MACSKIFLYIMRYVFLLFIVSSSCITIAADPTSSSNLPAATKAEEEYIRKGYVIFPPKQIIEKNAAKIELKDEKSNLPKKVEDPSNFKANDNQKIKKEKSLILIIED